MRFKSSGLLGTNSVTSFMLTFGRNYCLTVTILTRSIEYRALVSIKNCPSLDGIQLVIFANSTLFQRHHQLAHHSGCDRLDP